jgi:hypothetical protein
MPAVLPRLIRLINDFIPPVGVLTGNFNDAFVVRRFFDLAAMGEWLIIFMEC